MKKKSLLTLALISLLFACGGQASTSSEEINSELSSALSSENLSSSEITSIYSSEEISSENLSSSEIISIESSEQVSSEIPTDVNNFTFEKDANGELVLNEDGGLTIKRYTNKKGSTLNVVIPEEYLGYNITRIGDRSFNYAGGILSVTLSKNITHCSSTAFGGCTTLISINVEEGNENYISKDGLLYESDGTTLIAVPNAKEDVVLPSETLVVGDYAFEHYRGRTITLNEGISHIGAYAFANARGADSVTIPDSVIEFGEGVFSTSKFKEVILGNGLTSLPSYTFYKCGELLSITIPGSVKKLEYASINTNNHLESVIFEEGVQELDDYAISYNNSLKTVTFSSTITTIGEGAISNNGFIRELKLNEGLESIGDEAFNNLPALEKIYVPSTLKTVGKGVTLYCARLQGFIFNSTSEYFEIQDGALFSKDMKTLYAFPQWYGSDYCEYHVPSGVEVILRGAFSSSLRVQTVYLPTSLKEIQSLVFANGATIKVVYEGSEADWEKVIKGEYYEEEGQQVYVDYLEGSSAKLEFAL